MDDDTAEQPPSAPAAAPTEDAPASLSSTTTSNATATAQSSNTADPREVSSTDDSANPATTPKQRQQQQQLRLDKNITPPETSLSQHLNDRLVRVLLEQTQSSANSSESDSSKLAAVQDLQRHAVANLASNTDAHMVWEGPQCQAHLPELDWNQDFRKAYTLLLWVRPRLVDKKEAPGSSEEEEEEEKDKPQPRILYRLATHPDDSKAATGVCVTCSDWKLVQDDKKDNNTTLQQQYLETVLTAYSLPHRGKPAGVVAAGTATYHSWVRVSVKLAVNQWQLLTFSHVFPYLKRPTWTVAVDGAAVGTGELSYPALHNMNQDEQQQSLSSGGSSHRHSSGGGGGGLGGSGHQPLPVMDSNYLLHQVVTPALVEEHEETTAEPAAPPGDKDKKGDDSGTASRRHKEQQRQNWQLDVAAVAMYPEAVGLRVLAVAAEAGPIMALQSGRLLPTLPPICNWSKGSSLEGPKVGTPLVVHSVALELQRLSATQVFFVSAMTARVLGQDVETTTAASDGGGDEQQVLVHSRRILCTPPYIPGSTKSTPRVGLIQPGSAIRRTDPEEEIVPGSLYIAGHCRLVRAVDEYIRSWNEENNNNNAPEEQQKQTDGSDHKQKSIVDSTPYLSVALAEQGLLSALVLPFFLSLCPPTKAFDMKPALYTKSLQQLLALYRNDGALAAEMIRTLALYVQNGGGRVHEQVLQSGTLHILATSLRLGLIRAAKFQIVGSVSIATDTATTVEDLVRQNASRVQAEEGNPSQARQQEGTAPKYIPQPIVEACVELVNACCGHAASAIEDLSPSMQIRRTSDLALTALFGFALDYDLWGASAEAAAPMAASVAERYGGVCVTAGYILRSQMSVEHFLDAIRLRLDALPTCTNLQATADSLSQMLQAMLLSSLLNRRSIAQGEHDVKACVRALSDSPLGRCVTHVILKALLGLLVFCEILVPDEEYDHPVESSQERKIQVASRLGRSLLVTQFHDVIAPMILSRTAFSGERTMLLSKRDSGLAADYSGSLSWKTHWGHALHIFAWLASIAGPEGIIASRSCGSLLLASGRAGSLKGALDGATKVFINTLFLPPPGMALMVGSRMQNEWSYTDLLADRLQVTMPLLPGMIVSVLSHPPPPNSEDEEISCESLMVLSEILTSVGGAFHRVFGGLIHGASRGANFKQQVDGASETIRAAKTYVPHLLIVATILEDHIVSRLPVESSAADSTGNTVFTVLPSYLGVFETRQRGASADYSDSWVDVASTSGTESFVSEVKVAIVPDGQSVDSEKLISMLRSFQKSVLNTAAGLISNAMAIGGAGTTSSLWRSVVSTLGDSVVATSSSGETTAASSGSSSSHGATDSSEDNSADGNQIGLEKAGSLAEGILCRLIAYVLRKTLVRDTQSDPWSYELSSAVSTTCNLIEEKNLLAVAPELKDTTRYGQDQVMLLSALLDILFHGRESTGWCQLALPSMPASDGGIGSSMQAASKLLLPVLQPSFRLVLGSVRNIPTSLAVVASATDDNGDRESQGQKEEALLGKVISELDHTLTAAIVGLSFASARDSALSAMATLRKTVAERGEVGDEDGARLCGGLICKVAEELIARYESERRLRDASLFDAESEAVERLLGGEVLGKTASSASGESGDEVTFDKSDEDGGAKSRNSGVSDDFVLFQQSLSSGDGTPSATARLGFPEYDGLGEALEEVKINVATSESVTEQTSGILSRMSAFLDSWDSALEKEESESELVKLFDVQLGLNPSSSNVSGSETAADAMSSFFEFAADEKSRLKEVSTRFLPSHRYSRLSFTERFCWSEFTEFSPESIDELWERGMADGNRDMRSRIATLPCFPQFRQFIPGYLDHGATPDKPEQDSNYASPPDNRRRSTTGPVEMDEFTQALLKAGDLEIVDITKKETSEEDEPDLTILPSAEDALDDEFAESEPPSDHPVRQDSGEPDRENPGEPLREESERQVVSHGDLGDRGNHSFTTSSFSTAPDNASSSLGLMRSAAASLVEQHIDRCLHVKAEGSRPCTMLLTSSHLILEYEGVPEGFFDGEILAAEEEAERLRMIEEGGGSREDDGNERFQKKAGRRQLEVASLRPKSIRYNLFETSHIYLRRYRLRDSSIEIFFIPSGGTTFGGLGLSAATSSLFLDFGPGHEGQTRRDDAAFAIMRRAPPQAVKQWPDRSAQFLHEQISRLTIGWIEGRINNFDYLLHLNMLAGRSYNDICQYPVFPWVLSNYSSEEVPDLTDRSNFRDLTKPIGALNEERLAVFTERFSTFADPSIPPFMYGSHYSTSAGVVLHFLVRLHPFAGLHRQLQGGYFDVADRLFSSVPRTWGMCTGSSAAEVKEITPEWYCNPDFLRNSNGFMLGTSQDGELLGDVVLPPWADCSPEKFVEVMRAALESDICSQMLPDWIDLIFGFKQQGPESIKANNVYFYLTYYGAVDVANIKDEALRQATELQIAHFGQCPMQLFKHRPHPRRLPRGLHRLPFYQLISSHHERTKSSGRSTDGSSGGELSDGPVYLPFYTAPLSHWVHLDAPPPGPHAALVAVRFAGSDRTLAVDSQGIFHVFRWIWRAEEIAEETLPGETIFDRGCFVAQRELPRFRSVPRLMYSPPGGEPVTVAISKTLFASRSVLLVLSDADGQGSLGIQLIEPSKGSVRGEVTIPQIHSSRITCIATDPIGTAAGHGGVGGELALVGSADGNASIWRFMSSHHLPLRPRIVLHGHNGSKLSAVALCAPIQLAATVSSNKFCLHSITNGSLIRSFGPPKGALEVYGDEVEVTTKFADKSALAVSVQGFIVCVCENTIKLAEGQDRSVATLNLITVEGVPLGSMPLEPWRGLPNKIQCTPDGTAALVCTGRGVTIHRLSACQPLAVIDEFQITESDDLTCIPAALDIDLGPSLNRPVVAAAACSNGALRLHALPGISQWSERHKKGGISQTVGDALAKPARRIKSAVKEGFGIGRHIAGMGRDIGREVSSDVKERGVGGFLNNMVFGKGNSGNSN